MCWLALEGSGHVIDPRGTRFVRCFMEGVLGQSQGGGGQWEELEDGRGLEGFLLRIWFPSAEARGCWRAAGRSLLLLVIIIPKKVFTVKS